MDERGIKLLHPGGRIKIKPEVFRLFSYRSSKQPPIPPDESSMHSIALTERHYCERMGIEL